MKAGFLFLCLRGQRSAHYIEEHSRLPAERFTPFVNARLR
jgi:hypothetical protein